MASSSSTSTDDSQPLAAWKQKAADGEDMTPTKSWPELKQHWIAWLKQNAITQALFQVDLDHRQKRPHEFSFNKDSKQANLYIRRHDFDLITLSEMIDSHPALVIGSRTDLTNKVNPQAPARCHESIFDIKFKFCLGWRLTMGYTRHEDSTDASGRQITHTYVKFGCNCVEQWQREMSADLLLNLAQHQALFGYPQHQFARHWRQLAPPPMTPPTPLNQQPLAQEQGSAQEQGEKKKTSVRQRRRVAEEEQEVKEQSAEAEASEQEKVEQEKVAEVPPPAEAADVPPVLSLRERRPLPPLTRAAPADTTRPGSGETMTTPSEELLFAAPPTVLATDEELVPQYRSCAPPPQGQRFVVPPGRHIWRTSPAEQRQRFIEREHRKKHPHSVPLYMEEPKKLEEEKEQPLAQESKPEEVEAEPQPLALTGQNPSTWSVTQVKVFSTPLGFFDYMNKIDEEALDGFTLANRPRVEWIEDFGLTPEETTPLEENLAKANASKKVGPPVLGKMSPLPLTRAAPADTTVPGSGETMTTPSEELLFAARPTVLATDAPEEKKLEEEKRQPLAQESKPEEVEAELQPLALTGQNPSTWSVTQVQDFS